MKEAETAAEPPSCLQPPIFMIGRNSRGNWVAQERSGARGGVFIDRAGALKFAKFESGNHPHAVVWVSGILELSVAPAPAVPMRQGLAVIPGSGAASPELAVIVGMNRMRAVRQSA
jgi:hypothetical protein